MKRFFAVLLAALTLLLPVSAMEWDPEDPMLWEPDLPDFGSVPENVQPWEVPVTEDHPLLWEPDLPEFDGPVPRTGETPESFKIVMSFTGDMLLASFYGKRTPGSFLDYAAKKEPTYFLQNVRPVFEADDFTVVNLENVITDQPLTERPKTTTPAFWFKAGSSTTEILTSSSVEAVSLANNHSNDYGTQGYLDTIKAVTKAGLDYGGNDRTFYLEKNGYRIAVICNGLWSEDQAAAIIQRIKAAEVESDFQIVFYHGGAEAVHKPEEWRVRASRRLIDNGADLVLGNHAHVLQPREIYKGKEIIYSLGNFCFGGNSKPRNRTIIYQFTLQIDNGQLTDAAAEILPCYVYTAATNNYCPALITNEAERQRVLDFMDGKLALPY